MRDKQLGWLPEAEGEWMLGSLNNTMLGRLIKELLPDVSMQNFRI